MRDFPSLSSSSFIQRLKPTYGPLARQVPLLASFVRRCGPAPSSRPTSLPLDKLLSSQTYLYTFMQFMKKHDAIHVLQAHLTLCEPNSFSLQFNIC